MTETQNQQSNLTKSELDTLSKFSDANDRAGYWGYLASLNNPYGNLALGVAKNDTFSGIVANDFMAGTAAELGVTMTPALQQQIGLDIMHLDFQERQTDFNTGANNNGMNLTAREQYDIHAKAFQQDGLGPNAQAWTLGALLRPDLQAGQDQAAQAKFDAFVTDPTHGLLSGLNAMDTMAGGTLRFNREAEQWVGKVMSGVLDAAAGIGSDHSGKLPDLPQLMMIAPITYGGTYSGNASGEPSTAGSVSGDTTGGLGGSVPSQADSRSGGSAAGGGSASSSGSGGSGSSPFSPDSGGASLSDPGGAGSGGVMGTSASGGGTTNEPAAAMPASSGGTGQPTGGSQPSVTSPGTGSAPPSESGWSAGSDSSVAPGPGGTSQEGSPHDVQAGPTPIGSANGDSPSEHTAGPGLGGAAPPSSPEGSAGTGIGNGVGSRSYTAPGHPDVDQAGSPGVSVGNGTSGRDPQYGDGPPGDVPAVSGGFGDPGAPSNSGDQSGGGYAPLILNLSGGAVHTTDLATSGVTFDIAGAGQGVKTGWILPGEAFLVEDPNNAAITSGSQMVANFGQLAADDTNGDGQLSAAEASAAGLRLWLAQGDANGANVGTLETLSQAGVASIAIGAKTEGLYDNGNLISADASFTKTDGSTGDIADAFLMYGDALDNGMVYETQQGLTVRGTDGTAVTLVTDQHETVDTGASGIAAVIDAGSNNTFVASGSTAVVFGGDGSTLKAGASSSAALIGYGNGVTLVGGAGTNTLVSLGGDATVVTGTGTNTVYVEGDTSTVRAGLGTASVTVDGSGDTVLLGANDTATLNGNADVLSGGLRGGDAVAVNGQNDSVSTTLSTVTLADGVAATVGGSGNTAWRRTKSVPSTTARRWRNPAGMSGSRHSTPAAAPARGRHFPPTSSAVSPQHAKRARNHYLHVDGDWVCH